MIERSSELICSAEEAWAHAIHIDGVNFELMPWIRMSVPATARGERIADLPIGELAFQSWLLAFGFLPFDRHALTLVEVEPGRRFLEESKSWMQRRWRHERIVEPTEVGCRLTDRVVFEPRLRLLAALVKPVVEAIFTHRHRRLRKIFGPTANRSALN